ncbi:hypothetical protein Z517_04684 [Fonsecaea pedrosoi CBS 271.37]|uniref:NADH:flavin oxidoreductase/NADH oxidase N-terminal domain-containing protein n=1 Tax=Fonsecaea pedrosoi CBS 271.37 TaxID=1442368 RepID=A0A0D2GL54_9EURO|nr:uncharacterized protein Z517_04684 [Fonsecaea pedrosoi CBS 271.37]KIW81658.1 hypothetical protein Z517_04684 [Fonsecaea pedrosoi CBS 271.37]
MAPMTRRRAHDDYVPSELMVDYYAQRASVPGTLLISEAVATSHRASVWQNTTGIYNDNQMSKWQTVVEAVHAKGSYIFAQLWITGRAARPAAVAAGAEVISSSDIPWSPESAVPRALEEDEIWACVNDFRQAALNAIAAGFDGVEIHGANGYLVDQFTQDTCNRRTDAWGGNIENRARFAIEVSKAVTEAVGADRVGFRISPWCKHHGMGMDNPIPQFTYLLQELQKLQLAYLHIIEARVAGNADADLRDSIDVFVDAWNNTSPVIVAGGYTAESALQVVDGKYRGKDVLVAFGRQFISNPDLPFRVKEGIPFTKYNRHTFYEVLSPEGYTDYKFSPEFQAVLG